MLRLLLWYKEELQVIVKFVLWQKCCIENCGELGPDDDWGLEESDGTEDVYPPYPGDWIVPHQQLEIRELEDVVNKIKNSGNYFFKAKNYVRANAKYRKALRYIEW